MKFLNNSYDQVWIFNAKKVRSDDVEEFRRLFRKLKVTVEEFK